MHPVTTRAGSGAPRFDLRAHLLAGHVIPAHPLALTEARRLDERHQRALTRYYIDAGAGGMAVGVHTTQFEIREHGLLEPVLALASETADDALAVRVGSSSPNAHASPSSRAPARPFAKIAGVCGRTAQALGEARLAAELGYHAGLLSLGAWRDATEAEMLAHCRAVAEVIPLFGFYLQPAVGGRVLSYDFWRAFAEIPNVVAIKIAPFNRYQTIDVVRAVAESGRKNIALYTGNDDQIVIDLLTAFPCHGHSRVAAPRIVGGLLGQWAVWTRRAVQLLDEIKAARDDGQLSAEWLTRAAALTDANGAIFDVRHNFAGSIAGIQYVLWRQGLLDGPWCLSEREVLSPGQVEEIERVRRAYPELADDEFVAEHIEQW
ncbi:MAG TPA: dihydrodipicolinate synthase family protein [Gemmatimonadaceae bacterium]|nr:dihydrodipicolinate synthase family protein [Gemmatimonadaceae bacterium]